MECSWTLADHFPQDSSGVLQQLLALQPRPDGPHYGRHAQVLARRGDEGRHGLSLVSRVGEARNLRLPEPPDEHDDADRILRGWGQAGGGQHRDFVAGAGRCGAERHGDLPDQRRVGRCDEREWRIQTPNRVPQYTRIHGQANITEVRALRKFS